ncbi:MAG TPA: cupin domain-containing protein [Planctomycetota bacterium]|nr:cupin domain-containing protein [Planctomycetota bacterium]
MTPRAAQLVQLLGLVPHPEGGSYRETWRSASPPGARAAVTTIYFLLDQGERSRWHRVDAEEVWTHLEGGSLELWVWREGGEPECRIVGPVDAAGARPVSVVPAGVWQAARPAAGYVLSGCTVAPGFEFRGFTLLAEHPEEAELLRQRRPDLGGLC